MATRTPTATPPERIIADPANPRTWVRAASEDGHLVLDYRDAHPGDGDVNFPPDLADLLGAVLAAGRWYLIHRDGTATLHPLQDPCRHCGQYESGGRPGGDYDGITCSAASTAAAAQDDI